MDVDWQALTALGVYTAASVLCLIGFFLSCLSLSGTWLVFAAAGLVAWSRWPAFPGLGGIALFLFICVGVEVVEALAGSWGARRSGGGKAAGWAALGGGFAGMILGGIFIPVPVVGNLVGMLLGSFALAFVAEHMKMKKADHAARVATGAVLARLAVIFLKVGVTLLMTLLLAIGVALT